MKTRFFTFLLALLLAFSTLSACKLMPGADPEATGTTAPPVTTAPTTSAPKRTTVTEEEFLAAFDLGSHYTASLLMSSQAVQREDVLARDGAKISRHTIIKENGSITHNEAEFHEDRTDGCYYFNFHTETWCKQGATAEEELAEAFAQFFFNEDILTFSSYVYDGQTKTYRADEITTSYPTYSTCIIRDVALSFRNGKLARISFTTTFDESFEQEYGTVTYTCTITYGTTVTLPQDTPTTTVPTTTAPTTTAPIIPPEPTAWWDDVDFSDVNLIIGYNEVNANVLESAGAPNAIMYMKGPDDYADANRGDYLAAWQRHELVCDRLGLTLGENLTYVKTGFPNKAVDNILPILAQYVAVGGVSTPNIVVHLNYGMVRAGIVGYLYNACTTEYLGSTIENYFDFTHENWNLEAMEENAIDTNKIYMLMGDYFIDQLRFTMGTLVNSKIANEVLPYVGGLDYIYDLVYTGQWTYDTMMECAAAAGETNVGGQSVMGAISNQWLVRNYFAASGLDVFERDANGDPNYITDISEIHDWIDKLISMESEEYFSWDWGNDAINNPERNAQLTTFMNGGTLFSLNEHVLTMESESLRSMTDVAGILPNPKYVKNGAYADESTDYRGLMPDQASSGGIMITCTYEQFSAATAFLQLMTEEADAVTYQYLMSIASVSNRTDVDEQMDMLNFIKDGICSPMSMLYDNYCAKSIPGANVYAAPTYANQIYDSLRSGYNTFASKWDESITAKVNRWNQIKSEIRNRLG